MRVSAKYLEVYKTTKVILEYKKENKMVFVEMFVFL